jgi:N-methylhydantoinase B
LSAATELSIFRHLLSSVAEEMGVTLERTAYSPNIKERLDFSCAVFLATEGKPLLLAQAAHIPVHLGAMPASVQSAVAHCTPFQPGDVVILNDPYLGGNHLPDITMVSPVFANTGPEQASVPDFYVASRAHHADVGGMSPGSMPLSTELFQEGIIIPPIKLAEGGIRNEALLQLILRNVRTPEEREGDLAAQLAAHSSGSKRLLEIVARYGLAEILHQSQLLISYAERLTRAAIMQIPDGRYEFLDYLDGDGQTNEDLPIKTHITINSDRAMVDFSGTASAAAGNVNAVPAIVESAVAYCVRCVALALLDVDLPMNDGAFRPVDVRIPADSLLDPQPPHAVAAGNVETSQRIVDVVFGALAKALPNLIPAASQGTMNNLTFGGLHDGKQFAYYETIGGGVGAGSSADGGDGMHVHMSNTLNTPVEALEYNYPLLVKEYRLRPDSGGDGLYRGGAGLVRSIQFLAPVTATITSERRKRGPYGLAGGQPGQPGRNSIIWNEQETLLTGKSTVDLKTGTILRIATPGGGGWGQKESAKDLAVE